MKRLLLASSVLGVVAGSIVARREAGGNTASTVEVEIAPKGVVLPDAQNLPRVTRREPNALKLDSAVLSMEKLAVEIEPKGAVSPEVSGFPKVARREAIPAKPDLAALKTERRDVEVDTKGVVSSESQKVAPHSDVSDVERAAVDLSATMDSGSVMSRTFSGRLAPLDSYTLDSYSGMEGTATLLVTPLQTTSQVTFTGSAETLSGKQFETHLHDKPCPHGGGKHYQNPLGDGSVNDVNENWPIVACSEGGVCIGHAMSTWLPTDEALAGGLSIVIHDTPNNGGSGAGPKMLCADLL